jgi:AcrR family transcriptional regulator
MGTSVGGINVDGVNIGVHPDVDTVNIQKHNGRMPPKRSYHHPDLRQALLDGAVRLIKEEGMREFSLRKLATQVGVSHAAPYRHFDNKEAILATLMLEGHKRLRTSLLDAIARCHGKGIDKLLAQGRAYLEFARKNPEYLNVMFSREGMAAAMNVGEKLGAHQEDYDSFGVVERTVAECQAEGSMDPHADTGALSLHAWAEVHGLALLRNDGLIAGMAEMRGRKEAGTLDAIFNIMRTRWQR